MKSQRVTNHCFLNSTPSCLILSWYKRVNLFSKAKSISLLLSQWILTKKKLTTPTSKLITPHPKVAMMITTMSMTIMTKKNHSRRKDAAKNTGGLSPNAATNLNNTMPMACARTAIMPRAGRRKHPPVSTKIELCMPKDCAKTATFQSITKLRDQTWNKLVKVLQHQTNSE